jgi:hypothetical protein
MTMGHRAMEISLLLGAPLLLVALVIGLIVSIFQAATQINEPRCPSFPSCSRCSRRWWSPARGCSTACSTTCARCSQHPAAGGVTPSIFSVTSGQLEAWMVAFLWPFVRMLALVSTAPGVRRALGAAAGQGGMAAMLALVIAPTIGPFPVVPVVSAGGFWIIVQQVLIGAPWASRCGWCSPPCWPRANTSACRWACRSRPSSTP